MESNTCQPRWFCLLFAIMALFALPAHAMTAQQPIVTENLPYIFPLQYAEIPSATFDINPDSLDWKVETKRYRKAYSDRKRLYLLRSEFTLDPSLKGTPLYVYSSSSTYLCRIYVNGHFIAQRGIDKPYINDYVYVSDYYLIPDVFLNKGNIPDTLTVELTSHRDNQGAFPHLQLMTKVQAEHEKFVHNLFNIDASIVLLALGVVNTLFFLLIFFAQKKGRKDFRHLLFAAISLFYGLSYIDSALSSNTANSDCLQKISIFALILSLGTSILFVIEYYQFGKAYRKHASIFLYSLLVLLTGGIIWMICVPAFEVANMFNKSLHFITFPVLLTVLTICIWHLWHSRKWNNILMTIAYLAASFGTFVSDFELLPKNDLQFIPLSLLLTIFTLLYLFSREFSDLLKELYAQKKTLVQQNEMMEKTIEQRTHELSANNGKLNETVAELQKANAVKNRFFSIMAHDIKNPLNPILGFSNYLKDNYDTLSDDERKEFIQQINMGSNGLFKLLENLLEWSRIQVGTTQCNPDYYKISELVSMVLSVTENMAIAKNIRLKCSYQQDEEIFVDKNMIVTILRNLLGNAIKFTYPNNQVQLIIQVNEDSYEFTVADQGMGMTQKKVETLFHIDSIQSTAGTNQEQGTGLGLILCKEFTDLQKGTIEVESEVGKGTRITVRLPKKG